MEQTWNLSERADRKLWWISARNYLKERLSAKGVLHPRTGGKVESMDQIYESVLGISTSQGKTWGRNTPPLEAIEKLRAAFPELEKNVSRPAEREQLKRQDIETLLAEREALSQDVAEYRQIIAEQQRTISTLTKLLSEK